MTARREAINLMVGALMLVAATMSVHEAQERAQNAPALSNGGQYDSALVEGMWPAN